MLFNEITNLYYSVTSLLLPAHCEQVLDHGRVFPTLEALVGNLRATSRCWLRLGSADPSAASNIQPNYLDTEQDRYLTIYPAPSSRTGGR